uniref:Schlafen AlbA-2 domain-containing protein n=1 Tax=viral metagenome TaxID=1070528 RepID=A0A6C0AFE5_9ZZZZ
MTKLFIPELDLSEFDGETTSLNESDVLEYKENMSDGICRNIQEAICALLNREGGHIIVGIKNDLSIIGVNKDLYDKFLINCVDNIYHQCIIISGIDNKVLKPHLIKPFLHKNKSGKYLCIIKIYTEIEPKNSIDQNYDDFVHNYNSKHYKLKTGESFYRLNASNIKRKYQQRFYTSSEVESLKKSIVESQKLKHEKRYQKKCSVLSKLDADFSELEVEKQIIEIQKQKLAKENETIYMTMNRIMRLKNLDNQIISGEFIDRDEIISEKIEEKSFLCSFLKCM